MTRGSSGARERELAAPAREESGAERAVRGVAELGIPGDDGDGLLPRLLEDPGIAEEVGRAELRQPRLSRAEELARTPELQVHLGDLEPVAGRRHRADASLRLLGEAAAREKDAVRLPRAAPDAPAQLMELREPEPLGVLDEHDRRVGHVDAHPDHRRADEEVDLARLEPAHHRVLLLEAEPAMEQI